MKSTRQPAKRTDWDSYYARPYRTAVLSRHFTRAAVLRAIHRFCGSMPPGSLVVAELGGANSFFHDKIMRELKPAEYHVVDNNQSGMDIMRTRVGPDLVTRFHVADVRRSDLLVMADLVFSIGLIEHFEPDDTMKVIAAHFAILRPGGVVIMTFPVATLIYRMARFISEALGIWIFHDERPLAVDEVAASVSRFGYVRGTNMIWGAVFTQCLLVATDGVDPS